MPNPFSCFTRKISLNGFTLCIVCIQRKIKFQKRFLHDGLSMVSLYPLYSLNHYVQVNMKMFCWTFLPFLAD